MLRGMVGVRGPVESGKLLEIPVPVGPTPEEELPVG